MSAKKIIILIVCLILIVMVLGLLLLFVRVNAPDSDGGSGDSLPPKLSDDSDNINVPTEPPDTPPDVSEFEPEPPELPDVPTEPASPAEADQSKAKLLARTFLEDYGGYSSSSSYAHIERLYKDMTPEMMEFTRAWIAKDPALERSTVFYSIETRVTKVTLDEYSGSNVALTIEANRIETDAPEYYNKSYTEQAEVQLVKEIGEWKVKSVDWK